jgi:toxin ParE1/3/4
MKLRLSPRAKADLDSIYLQGEDRFGHAAADAYIGEINEKFSLLLAFPLSNPLRSEIRPPVRLQPYKGHVIMYRVEPGYVVVGRVLSRFENWQEDT